MTRKKQAMEIRIAMMRKRVTQTAIAKSLNPPITQAAVYNVIEGKSESLRVKKAIAQAVGSTIEELWPKEDDDEDRRAA